MEGDKVEDDDVEKVEDDVVEDHDNDDADDDDDGDDDGDDDDAAPEKADTHLVRACAVETRVKIWQKPLYAEIYRQNAAAQSEHPDQAPAFRAIP